MPFGNVIADMTEPVLTKIVNSAYPNGNPIPADPSKYQPATPFSSLTQLAATTAEIPGAIKGLTAATGSGPKTTSRTAITAADAPPYGKKNTATPEKKPKPLTNVLRESVKAVPKSKTGEGSPSTASDPVATVDKPTKEEPQETAQSEPTQPGRPPTSRNRTPAASQKAAPPEAGSPLPSQ